MCCNKSYQRKFGEKFKERFFNTYKFPNHDNNNFILLKQKGVYAYEYMNDWKEINETWLPEKEDFYSYLNLENVTDADYAHPKEILKILQKIWTCKYHDLYVQSDTLLLADVFENLYIYIIWNIYFNIFELNPAKFISVPVLAWQEALKKDYSKIRSFNWHRYVINVRKR